MKKFPGLNRAACDKMIAYRYKQTVCNGTSLFTNLIILREEKNMAKRKTLPKNFEKLVKDRETEKIKKVFDKCDINAYGGYNKGNAFSFLISEDLMKWLLEQGADINYTDEYGYTPLLYHAGHAFAEQQAIHLVELGADIHAVSGLYKENALHYAAEAGSLKLVQCLFEAGTDPNALDLHENTPLEAAFYQARTFDLVKLAPVAEYFLSRNITVTGKMQKYMLDVAKDIEFRRSSLNPDYIDELDEAMNRLYDLLHVAPVEKRVEYDGSSPIVIKEKTWQKQHGELWRLLVPGSGHAATVQGEVIRISGKISYELLDNGGVNWDKEYRLLTNAFLQYLHLGNPLAPEEYKELERICRSIRRAADADLDRLSELAVKWVSFNTDPIPVGEVGYTR